MDKAAFYVLNRITVVDIHGADAVAIINNLTTNEVKPLKIGQGRETFVTDVKGKTLGHVNLFRLNESVRLIGAAGQSERITQQVDRYTIREDAASTVRDQDFTCVVLSPAATACVGIETGQEWPSESMVRFAETDVSIYRTGWLGNETTVLLIPSASFDAVRQSLRDASLSETDESEFHLDRVLAGYPWYGIDLDESNLPQELDRDELAISFTKGCYLGQETIARLDALGQVQRKLVRWNLDGAIPSPGATLSADGKAVGRLTSIAVLANGETIALGFARRSHFAAGAVATGSDSGGNFTGTVH